MARASGGANNMHPLRWRHKRKRSIFMGAKTSHQGEIRSRALLCPKLKHLQVGYQARIIYYLTIAFILATDITSQREKLRSLKNEEDKREKVT